ncbi:MAG: DUF4255 domain-containing protein [Cyanobacteria bacterium SBLK]|nr:DUF4255 domain-containing protein [Cyanobacteria bacterium SBLK]
MSNHLAIATVTAVLRKILQEEIREDLPSATVTTARPHVASGGTPKAGINIYLYQATPNPAWRNADLRTRRPKGDLIKHGQAGLDLHYLLTFYGNELELEPQRLLGSTVRALVDRPIITPDMIRTTLSGSSWSFLRNSTLAEQVQLVKFIPAMMTAEELSRIWSIFFQIPYSLSFAYQATAILIQGEKAGKAALPVRTPQFGIAVSRPIIETVESFDRKNPTIFANSQIKILGREFRGDRLSVQIGNASLTPDRVEDTEIHLQLSPHAKQLRSGVQSLQIIADSTIVPEQIDPTTNKTLPPKTSRGFSNTCPMILCPQIEGEPRIEREGSDQEDEDFLTAIVNVNILVGLEQQVFLLLNRIEDGTSTILRSQRRDRDTYELHFRLRNLDPGNYLIRVQIDGAESPLTSNSQGYSGPSLILENNEV